MRLFLAVRFEEKILNQLCTVRDALQAGSVKGNFTRRENFHLTLVFLGETVQITDVMETVDRVARQFDPFCINLGKGAPEPVGCFPRRKGGDIYWVGAVPQPELTALSRWLAEGLREGGFQLEREPYRPHVTLGRQVRLADSFDWRTLADQTPEMIVPAGRVCVMQSGQTAGRLIYSEVYGRDLGEIR